MHPFISEESIAMHLEYLNTLKLKLSLASKSLASARGRERKGRALNTAKRLEREIMLHEVYFDSFCEREYSRSDAVRRTFGSENELLNTLFRLAIDTPYGFVGVGKSRKDIAEPFVIRDYGTDISGVILAIDVSEHAYFRDYGFDKEGYLKRALAHLALGRVDDFH